MSLKRHALPLIYVRISIYIYRYLKRVMKKSEACHERGTWGAEKERKREVMYMYVYMHMYMYAPVNIYIHVCVCVCVYVCMYVCTYIHTYIHTESIFGACTKRGARGAARRWEKKKQKRDVLKDVSHHVVRVRGNGCFAQVENDELEGGLCVRERGEGGWGRERVGVYYLTLHMSKSRT